jgi:hypothetical protein
MICPSLKKCLCVSTLVILLALNLDLLLFTYNEGSFIFPLKFLNKNISRTPPFKKWSINFSKIVIEKNLETVKTNSGGLSSLNETFEQPGKISVNDFQFGKKTN